MSGTSSLGRRALVFGVVCCAVAVATLSCATPAAPPRRHDRTSAAQLEDRDEGAVVDALRRLDLCALLGTAVAEGTVAAGLGPSSCTSPGLDVAVATLGTDKRVRLPSRIVSGAKVYLQGTTGCTVWVPVSFRLAIQFRGDQACDAMADAVAPAVAALADPDVVEAAPRWEACTALRTVRGTEVERIDDLDGCADKKSLVVLALRYKKPSTGWRKDVVDDVEVWTLDDRDEENPSCTAEWIVGPAVTSHAASDLVAQIRGADCGEVTPMIAPLVATLRKNPGAGSPQRPLPYGPDDPDSPYPGACAYIDFDIGDPTVCAPYTSTSVPPDDELVSATDPKVSCAVAVDAVATGFGAAMKPVTIRDRGCRFVSPERLVEVDFVVWPERLGTVTSHGPDRVTVAGHPGFVKPSRDGDPAYQVLLAATTSSDQPGVLMFEVTPGPVAPGPLPAKVVAEVEPVLTEIVRQHFSG